MRREDLCGDCGHYKPPTRDYDHLHRYDTGEMDESEELQRISFPIEAGVCSLDRELGFTMTDGQAIAVFELLLDIYTFGDTQEQLAPRIAQLGCASVVEIVERELHGVDRQEVAKVLGAVRFVARRRNIGGRHHLEVLHRYCGSFFGPGLGLRRLPDGTEIVTDAT